MSDKGKTARAWSFYIDDMIGFVEMIVGNLRSAGVQQAHKKDKIDFISLTPGPSHASVRGEQEPSPPGGCCKRSLPALQEAPPSSQPNPNRLNVAGQWLAKTAF